MKHLGIPVSEVPVAHKFNTVKYLDGEICFIKK